MRVRTLQPETTTVSNAGYWRRCNGQTRPWGLSGTRTFSTIGGSISDVPSSRRFALCANVPRPDMKPCEHSKWSFTPSTSAVTLLYYQCGTVKTQDVPYPYPDTDTAIDVVNAASLYYYLGYGMYTDPAPALLTSCLTTAGTIHDPSSHYDRWLKAKPSMASRANMSVFLYELRDIKRMFDLLPNKHFSVGSWKEVLKYGNGLHLNWNFGWKPFLRDLHNVTQGLRTFETRLYKFLHGANESLVRHSQDPVIEGQSCPPGADINYWSASWDGNFYSRHRSYWKATYRSTFHFSYSLPALSYEELRWRAYLDTLGLAATPANIWAVIPWSFVIDWFVNVGEYLDRYSRDWIEPWIIYCQACTSMKLEVTRVSEIRHLLSYYGVRRSPQIIEAGRLEYSHYTRSVGLPSLAWTNRGTLDSDKIRLLASLVASRIL